MRPRRIMLFTLLVVALATSACTFVITPPPPAQLNANGVIFTAEQSTASLDAVGILNGGIEDTWTPSEADVAKLEADLPAFLQASDNPMWSTDEPIWEREPDYMRQYLGIIQDGEEVIHANFFCTINEMDWHSDYVFVMDGGDCFFTVNYNPSTGEFFDLSVNGQG